MKRLKSPCLERTMVMYRRNRRLNSPSVVAEVLHVHTSEKTRPGAGWFSVSHKYHSALLAVLIEVSNVSSHDDGGIAEES